EKFQIKMRKKQIVIIELQKRPLRPRKREIPYKYWVCEVVVRKISTTKTTTISKYRPLKMKRRDEIWLVKMQQSRLCVGALAKSTGYAP
ncbi:MAG: hypothetical protein II273_02540, partial [Lachnospiraceae bacterium]|nr:hypothetical protein [Lachnospiraceae bacterium]